ncbi:MAG: peptide chain release factor N(5)-glutamine methyltransferase [Croceibacterium sp.]
MTVAEALREAARRLAATSDSARFDAELLMAHALGTDRSDLLVRRMAGPVPPDFARLIERRGRHEPVAYIIGTQPFGGREFRVTTDVLIPRADSETTVAAALEACSAPRRVLDCGTGSGALLLTVLAECPAAEGIGIERSPQALAVATGNAERLGLAARATFALADWREPGWADSLGTFDLIIANPPYVESGANLAPDVREWEPAGALFAGTDGLGDYRVLVPQLPALLGNGGVAVLEIGAAQSDAVTAIAADAGFSADLRRDTGGRPRAVILRLGLGR